MSFLNGPQKDAVMFDHGPALVLAGAGSGKTRVLTHRIVRLIESGVALPGEILALTFTNKAAKVMKERITQLLDGKGVPSNELWVSTFHSMGAKLLRLYGNLVGLDSNFTIYDDSDQMSLIKSLMEKQNLSDRVVSPKAIMYRIGSLKNDGASTAEFQASSLSFADSKMAPIIRAYDAELRKNNAVDFGDLIYLTLKLFKDNPSFREQFQDRYRFLLVDEYQDTNPSQYMLLKLMTEKHRNLFVVGDEDQSIYGWRGADIRNILDFEKDYSDAKVIKLEENYRSTGHIIKSANGVISNNVLRKEKVLFTSNSDGDLVESHEMATDLEEARWTVKNIVRMRNDGFDLREMAIFYRTHAQSRLFEDQLRYEKIPYKIFGGVKFYDRAEIKDAIAYLRLFVNSKDEISLNRIINVPARGLGKQTLDSIREFAFREGLSFLEALGLAAKGETGLGSGPQKRVQAFLELFAKLQKEQRRMSPVEFYGLVLSESGYLSSLEKEASIESEARLENLKELGTVIQEYETQTEDPTLQGFLEEVALVTDAERDFENPHFVSLMTVHAAKGLEFDIVFVSGLEEELFPHVKADNYGAFDKESIEEERRLCYVAMTRARKHLYLTHSQTRRVFGVSHVRRPSRFLSEVPGQHIQFQSHGGQQRKPWALRSNYDEFSQVSSDSGWDSYYQDDESSKAPPAGQSAPSNIIPFGTSAVRQTATAADDSFGVGKRVRHPDYGQGTVTKREGQHDSLKVTVQFPRFGAKKFVVKFAPLEPLS
jgi:DNA helicase-2/ATP-dependent DNA helicase PcrA